ncbi:MAG: heavy metal-binding domain-containing protein [Bacteroidota bacterium]
MITLKKIINPRSLAIMFFLSLLIAVTSCGSKHEHADDHEGEHDHAYACPMHPEVTGHEGDKCSKCGMNLELVKKETDQHEYFMAFQDTPAVEAGKTANLSFTPKIKGLENEMVPLDIQHGKKLHLIVVSKDLSYFDHIHPEFQSSGSYDITVLPKDKDYSQGRFANETRFEKGGDYILFVDYLPTGASHQLERIELNVAGTPYAPAKFTTEKTTGKTDGYDVSIVPDGGKFFSEGTMHIAGIIKKDGKEIPADQFENYLGAKAHVVVISEDTKDYLHVHPEVVAGRLDLHTSFGRPGIFRGWMQFQTNGQVHTADFTIKVEEGKAPESAHGGDDAH